MTSVSLDRHSIAKFGECDYLLLREKLPPDGHVLTEHQALLSALRDTAKNSDKDERAKAVQALRYARLRREGIVLWGFDISGVDRKDLINWAGEKIRVYFKKV